MESAEYKTYIRKSPQRYGHVKSKVARCLKVQKSINRRNKQIKSGIVTAEGAYTDQV